MTQRFDAVVVGTGQAGPSLARRLAATGRTVAIVERKLFGGTCVNTGCTPTKALVASARAAHVARRAGEYGVVGTGQPDGVRVDLARALSRAQAIARASREHVEGALRHTERCTVLTGHARFESSNTLRVGDETLTAYEIFINTGGRAAVPPFPGVEHTAFLTNSSILELDVLPEHLIVVGGSYVGLEFAQMFRRFGSAVTVVEREPRLVRREDLDVSAAIQDILEREGIAIRLSADCISLSSPSGGVTVHVECAQGAPTIAGSHVLLAVGRRPNTDDLGLDRAGLAVDAHGYIVVDDELRTSVPGIWALGDCNGHGAFTHTAYNDFEIVASNLLAGDHRRVSDRIPCYALYIDPPLGRAGQTESEARASGRPLLAGTLPMSQIARAIEKGETLGFMKVVVDAETQKVLGASVLGTGGDEVIHGILDTMYAGGTRATIERSVAIHPTVSELIPTLLGGLRPA